MPRIKKSTKKNQAVEVARHQKDQFEKYLLPLEINSAASQFTLFIYNSLSREPMHLHISLLKKYFEQYKLSPNHENIGKVDLDLFTDTLDFYSDVDDLKGYLEKLFDLPPNPQDFIKMAICIKIRTLVNTNLLANNEDKAQQIFVLINALLPYYPIKIRSYFNLEGLFLSCQKIQTLYFCNLKIILAKKESLSPLFTSMKFFYLCSTLMWANTEKSIKFILIKDIFSVLSPYLESFLLRDYSFDDDVTHTLASPLRIIDLLISYHQSLPMSSKTLQSLNKTKEVFFNFYQEISLQTALGQEFILFLDKALDFARTTTIEDESLFILEHLKKYTSLIEKFYLSYHQTIALYKPADNNSSEKQSFEENNAHSILIYNTLLKIIRNLDHFLKENNEFNEKIAKIANDLIKQEESDRKHQQQKLNRMLLQIKTQKEQQVAKALAAKKTDLEQDKKILTTTAAALENSLTNPLADLDHYQNQLFRTLLTIKNPEEKEKFILREINLALSSELAEVTDNYSLKLLEKKILSHRLSSKDTHKILLLYIALLDIYLEKIAANVKDYKNNYRSLIEQVKNKYGYAKFEEEDRLANREINLALGDILENFTSTHHYCEYILQIFNFIDCLKTTIITLKDKKSYEELLDLSLNFRKGQYDDVSKDILSILHQFQEYRQNKESAFKAGKIPPVKSKLKKICTVSEKNILSLLENLKTTFEEITQKIAEPSNRQQQMREEELEKTIIDPEKPRTGIPYDLNERFRRSESISDFFSELAVSHSSNGSIIQHNLTRRMSF